MKGTCAAALNLAGEHFPCQTMDQMADGSENHDGWAHSNRDAEALWCSDVDPLPEMRDRVGLTTPASRCCDAKTYDEHLENHHPTDTPNGL